MIGSERSFARGMRFLRQSMDQSQTALANSLRAYGIELDGSAITRMEAATTSQPRAIRLSEALAIADIFGYTIEQVCCIGDVTDGLATRLRRLANEIEGAL